MPVFTSSCTSSCGLTPFRRLCTWGLDWRIFSEYRAVIFLNIACTTTKRHNELDNVALEVNVIFQVHNIHVTLSLIHFALPDAQRLSIFTFSKFGTA